MLWFKKTFLITLNLLKAFDNPQTKRGQIVHKTAPERKPDKETNTQTVTQIHRHREKYTHKKRDKGTNRQTDTHRARKHEREGSKKKVSFI